MKNDLGATEATIPLIRLTIIAITTLIKHSKIHCFLDLIHFMNLFDMPAVAAAQSNH